MNKGIITLKILTVAMLTVIVGLLVWFAATFAGNVQVFIANVPKDDRIHFLKMENAEAILVESNGEYGLIDAGYNKDEPLSFNTESTGTHVLEYLNKKGVKHLKFIIATHPHKDHVGGIPELVNNSTLVDKNTTYIYKDVLIIPKGDTSYKHQIGYYTTTISGKKSVEKAVLEAEGIMREKGAVMLDTLSVKSSALKKLKAKVSKDESIWDKYIYFQMGDFNIKIYNLSFYVEMLDGEPYVDINSNSLITLITSKQGKKVLLMADSTLRHKREIHYGNLVGKVDVLKAGHHGISYSNSRNLIETTNPAYTIVTNSPDGAFSRGFAAPYTYINNYGGEVYFTSDNPVVLNLTNKLFIEEGLPYTNYVKDGWYDWYQNINNKNTKVRYYIKDNTFLTGLQKIEKKRYYFDEYGRMQGGWQIIEDKLYYFEPQNKDKLGQAVTNRTTSIDGHRYRFNKKGICESSSCKKVLKNLKEKTN